MRITNKLVKLTGLDENNIATSLSEACTIRHVGQQCCVKVRERDINSFTLPQNCRISICSVVYRFIEQLDSLLF